MCSAPRRNEEGAVVLLTHLALTFLVCQAMQDEAGEEQASAHNHTLLECYVLYKYQQNLQHSVSKMVC
jgi:hypothetical protein